jgi:hypothetical protein
MIETEVRQVTKVGTNLFCELGFSSAEARRVQVEIAQADQSGTANAGAVASKRASRLVPGVQMLG